MTTGKAAAPRAAANENTPVDQDALGLAELAEGVLTRDFRPRVGTIRRLAEAVLALQQAAAEAEAKAKKARKKAAAASSSRKGKSKAGGKKRKLAKIPGQKG